MGAKEECIRKKRKSGASEQVSGTKIEITG
jgi:hypothetical protein